MTALAAWAIDLGRSLVGTELPTRWKHDEQTIGRVREVGLALDLDTDLLVAAAAVHDLGHTSAVRRSGFQPLDTAWHLQGVGAPRRLVDLVATHACARREAELRGLAEHYDEFTDEEGPLRDALWYGCLTTSPSGGTIALDERIAGWAVGYPGDDVVQVWARQSEPEFRAAIARTEQALDDRGAR